MTSPILIIEIMTVIDNMNQHFLAAFYGTSVLLTPQLMISFRLHAAPRREFSLNCKWGIFSHG